jgi:hypothetical protein
MSVGSGMMAEDGDPEIASTLAKLAQQDPAAADDAEAALEWIAGERGQAGITQECVQNFCWYLLPMKWLISYDEKLRVVAALAQALDLLQLPRYAVICRSATTRDILGAYEADSGKGKAAFRRAAAASGITAPDLPEFEWGAAMGLQEASAWSAVADFLEVAVASGDLVPGSRGWKARQQELVRTYLNMPQPELIEQTYAQAILTERAETWVGIRRSETRRRIVAAIANQLLHPARPPAGTTDPLPRLRWLLGELNGGIALTQTGNLNRMFVQQNADRFGWDFDRPPRTEDELFDLHQLREFAQQLGLARRAGRRMTLTARGRRLLADPEQLWRAVSAGLLAGGTDFTTFAGELFLAVLLQAGSVPGSEITATGRRAAEEEGFREDHTFEPPGDAAISWAVHDTSNRCRALGLLAVGADWHDRSYGLTDTGKATALEALRARATGPRTVPWP